MGSRPHQPQNRTDSKKCQQRERYRCVRFAWPHANRCFAGLPALGSGPRELNLHSLYPRPGSVSIYRGLSTESPNTSRTRGIAL
jgi:hypothetical protein